MVKLLKKCIGISSAVLASATLLLSLSGVVGPGCGANSGDACQVACKNISSKCVGSYSSSGGSGMDTCEEECRLDATSGSYSSSGEYNALVECVAQAPSCLAIRQCGGSSTSTSY